MAGTLVTPDGRTQTSVTSAGGVTGVTTSTVQNGNAYNSFSQFQVGQGDTVNLYVPDSAQRLLNVVHNAPVDVEGTLNSYQSGKIGGNVYFADPYGFLVGQSGSVNVGSLTVRTPTADATQKLIDAQGKIDAQATSDLINNVTPVSANGSVVVKGRITAPDGLHLTGQAVTTTSTAQITTGGVAQKIFDATVNTAGLQQSGGIAVHNGVVEITATGDASVDGSISADAADVSPAGQITVTAGGDIALAGTARISAKGNGAASNGGNIKLYAGGNLNVGSGAVADVSAGTSGDGGTIELSAAGTANFSGMELNAGAPGGNAGTILIDPTVVDIENAATYGIPGDSASIDTDGGSVTIKARTSITLGAGAYINTRQTGASTALSADDTADPAKGNSGDVDLEAPKITIAGSIHALAIEDDANGNPTGASSFSAGKVSLIASGKNSVQIGSESITSTIDISGVIQGGVIDVEANASPTAELDTLDEVAQSLVNSLFGAGAGYVNAEGYATIDVEKNANIYGQSDVTLNSWTNANATDPVFIGPASSLIGSLGIAPSVLVGNVTAKATAQVDMGASIFSGGTLTVRAHNTANLDAEQITFTGSTPIDASVAYTTADVESLATVAEGATINANNVDVVARNDNSFKTSVTVLDLGDGNAGLAAAIFDHPLSTATAHFGPSLTLPSGGALNVEADSLTSSDAVEASSSTGSNKLERGITGLISGADSKAQSEFSDELDAVFDGLTDIKIGSAISLTLGEKQSSSATLGGDAANAPAISGAAVSVLANTVDAGVRSDGDSSVNSPNVKDGSSANPAALIAVSAGVALSDRTLSATANIGAGAQVTAPDIAVQSNVLVPVTMTWLDGDNFSTVMSHINGNIGIANDILTSLTDATADAGLEGVMGSVNLMKITANSSATVGEGAILSSVAPSAAPWTVTLDSADNDSHGVTGATTQSFDSAIDIAAQRSISTINFSGNLSIFLNGLGGEGSSTSQSFGAAYEGVTYSGSTIAAIGADASVTSSGTVSNMTGAVSGGGSISITAAADDKAIDVSPAAGHGGGTAIDGMYASFELDTQTHASIASSALVSATNPTPPANFSGTMPAAPTISLIATQGENIGTVAGALLFGNSNSVGGMYTQNTIDTDVKAYVGDNLADYSAQSGTQSYLNILNFTAPVAGVTASGAFHLSATESGTVQSLAVSVDAGTNNALGAAIAVSSINDGVAATLDGAVVSAKDVYLNANADDTIQTIAVGVSVSTENGIAGSGSAASATLDPTVTASITDGSDVTAANNIGVLALNNDEIDTIAGAAGISDGGAGIGISVVVSQISGNTTASITGADTKVDANGGDASDTIAADPNDTFMVNSGTLVNAPDVGSISAPTATAPSLAETQTSVSGLAVVSTAHQAVVADAVTLGVGKNLGLAIVPVTTIISGTSKAIIQDAQVDTRLWGDPKTPSFFAPQIDVTASNHSYTGDFIAAIAGGGLAGAAASSAVKFQGTAQADMVDATVGTPNEEGTAVGAVDINAMSTQAAAVIVVGGAGGMNAGAASLAVTLFSATTDAYLTGGTLLARSLTVDSASDNGVNVLDGAAAVGNVGIGGSIVVTTNDDSTLGYVGDLQHVINGGVFDDTALTVGSASLSATTNNNLYSLDIAGTGSAAFGLAAMADVTTLSDTTTSGFYDTDVNESPVPKAGNISVAAVENDSVDANVGGGSASAGAAVGVAANVVVLHASVTGTILDSDINSAADISVSATGSRSVDALTITGSIGGAAGISASVGAVLVGTNASSDVSGQLDNGGSGTLSDVSTLSGGVSGDPANSGIADAISATIAGGSVTAATLELNATGKTTTSNQADGVAAGGFAGVGGAVAYSDIGSTVIASIGDSLVAPASPTAIDAPSVSMIAQALDGTGGQAAYADTKAGGGGLVGIGAGISIAKIDNQVTTQFVGGSATGNGAADLLMQASDSTSGNSVAEGGAVGGVAVGIMVATAQKDSAVNVDTQTSAVFASYDSITLAAQDKGALTSSATGVSGGLADAANAAAATATDNATVNARLGDNTQITGDTGLVTLSATDMPNAGADAYGVAVADGSSLGVSVALVSLSPTVMATTGDSVSVDGTGDLSISATLVPVTGQTTGNSSAFAGAGGTAIALDGAVATTTNNADVEAVTGTNLILPGGDISILASDTSDQNAKASGVGVGGIAGGASYSQAVSNATTKAVLGDGASSNDIRTGDLSVVATGLDTDTAHSIAGTYGLVAGNASISETDNNATVRAKIGDDVSLDATSVTLQATHDDNYSEFADSTEVSVLGASGAGAIHNADVTVKAKIGDGTTLISTGDIDGGSENDFARIGTDDAADAGGGGILNGAGATSNTTITGDSKVKIGDGVTLVSGNDPVTNPASISLIAGSAISADDVVSLSTGGALEGAGTSNDFTATLNNDVKISDTDELLSFGNINIGTVTTTSVTAKSLGSTWGILGAVADATADVDLTTAQKVSVGAGADLLAYGNINVTAGQDPTDAAVSSLVGAAEAETYVSGFIAIPAAHAQSDVTNNTTLKIKSGATLQAGENVNLGAFTGTLTPQTDGTGHGYELGFIPVTDGSGTGNATPHATSAATIDGDVTAGAFHDLTVDIADCQNVGIYCGSFTVTGGLSQASYYDPAGIFLSQLSPSAYIDHYISGTDAQLLVQGVSSTPVDAVVLNTLFASGGSVTVNAASVTGQGTLTANGEASITVNNLSPDYLVLGQVDIPDIAGGHVFVTGGASQASATAAGITISENDPTDDQGGGARNVNITNAFTGVVGTSTLGPAIFVTGDIQNLGGMVQISAPFGSLGQFSPIVAENVVINVPQGVLLVDLSSGLLESAGASPIASWAPYMIIPGGNPAAGTPNADQAIAYAVNAVYNSSGSYTTPDAFSTALYNTTDGKGSNGATLLVYGNCLPTRSGNKCQNGNSSGPTGLYWDLDHFSGFGSGRTIADVPNESLTYSTNTPPPTDPTASAITANEISITASYIDIDSDITAGTPTNWSVDIPSTVQSAINGYQSSTAAGTSTVLTGVTTSFANDSLIKVSYVTGATAADGYITVDNVLASSPVAASIKLDGDIINTSTVGHIHVNAGLGQVTIDNQTSTPVTVNDISAGNSDRSGGLTGTLEIVDPLKVSTGTDHWWYVYTPGQGTQIYTSSDLNASFADAALASSTTASAFTYDPLPNMRFVWQQTAFLSRTVTFSSDADTNPTTTDWEFTNPSGVSLGANANQPWYYTDTYAPDATTYTQDAAHAGTLMFNQGGGPLLEETITGSATITSVNTVNASCVTFSFHCSGGPSSNNFSTFTSSSGEVAGIPTGLWDFDYITKGTVTLTTSVKADNPIGIDFSGSTRGIINIASNAPVTINGQITNPDGDTTVTTSAGNITTTVNGGITSNKLDLSATDGSVGTSASLLTTTQVNNGSLSASGTQGVYIAANSAVNIDNITASGGDVVLTAKGNITGAQTASIANIIGVNTSLTATQGGNIGPLTTAVTGTLNATADGSISLEQVQGNLSAGSIQSVGIGGVPQSVTIAVDQGALLDAATTTAAQTIDDTELQSIWKTLKLTVALGADANTGSQSTTIKAVTSTVDSDYAQYWLLLSHGQGDGTNFQLDANAAVDYQAIANASNETAQQYAQGLYTKLVSDFTQYIGQNWQSAPDFQADNPNFSFTLTQAQIDGFNANSVWTEGQLKSALSVTALQPSTITALGSGTANVSGGDMTLTGASGIGSLAAPVSITIGQLQSGNLTPDQERAIALAKNPGDIVFVGVDGSGNTVTFGVTAAPDGTISAPAGVTITGVQIKQTAPLLVNSSGVLNARAAQGGIFIQATAGSLNLGLVDAGAGDIDLAAPQNITAANPSAPFILNGGTITLLAANGSLGSLGAALSYKGSEISSASAGQDVYLQDVGGNLVADRIFAGQDASLDAPDGSIVAGLDGVNLIAGNLELQAGNGDIGSVLQPFSFELADGGELQGSATGSAYLASTGALQISSFTSGGDLAVAATGNASAASLSAGGHLSVDAGGDLSLTQSSGAGIVELASGGNAQISNLSSAGDLTGTAVGGLTASSLSIGGDLTLNAGGDLSLSQSDSVGATGVTSGSDTQIAGLMAEGGVTATANGALAASQISSNGNITLGAGGALSLTQGNGAGVVGITSGGDAQISGLSAGRDITVTANGGLTVGSLNAGGKLALNAGGDLTLDHVSSVAAASVASQGSAQISTLAAGGNLAISAAGTLNASQLTGSAGLTVKSGGNLVLGPASSVGAAQVTANGNAQISSLLAGGNVAVTTTGDLNASQIVSTGGNITAKAGGGLIMGQATSAGTLQVAAAGAAVIGQLNSSFSGDHAISVTADTISGNGGTLANLVAPAGAKAYLAAQHGIGSASLYLTVSVPALLAATTSGGVYIHALSDLVLADINVPGSLGLLADSNLTFGNIQTGQSATLSAGKALVGNALTAGGSATLTAGAGSIQIGHLLAPNLALLSSGDLNLNDITAANLLSIAAPDIVAKIAQSGGSGPLQLSIGGMNGGSAGTGNLSINAPAGVTFTRYFVANGTIVTSASLVDIQQAIVSGQLLLTTPATNLYVNDRSLRPVQNVTEQFYAPAGTFFLEQDGTNTRTNAFAVDFGAGFNVTTIDAQGNARAGVSLARGAPLPLYAPTWVSLYAQQHSSDLIDAIYAAYLQGGVPTLAPVSQWVSGIGNEAAVNISSQ